MPPKVLIRCDPAGTCCAVVLSRATIIILVSPAINRIGKHDMPLVFRLVGRAVGKVSGFVQGARARMTELSKGSDLMQVRS